MSRTCPYCNSSEIDEDPSRGDATCMGCGTVLEESQIVADVQFQETGAGGYEVIGQFVSQDRAGTGGAGQPKPESREVTYYKGKKLIQEIASQLRINQHCINTAYEFFKMAVNRNFTRGRVRAYVVAACLYMTCRLENTSHLLLDFSDVTQVNVFDLGRTLNFLTRSLKINLPATDPCLYVLRFAIMLDFGDKQKEVVSLATRIVQRMKRDWMATGRRPTGICGAALLLAARAHNVNRAVSDIVKVVHISETVVRKRLDEFAITASGNLTIDEFNVIDLEDSEDPPAYREARQRRLRDNKRKEEESHADQVTQDFANLHEEVENALRDKMKRSPYGTKITGYTKDDTVPELQLAREVVQPELVDNIYSVADNGETFIEVDEEQPTSFQQKSEIYGPSLRSLGLDRSERQSQPFYGFSATTQAQPSTSSAANVPLLLEEYYQQSAGQDDLMLEDIDDSEIDNYILSDAEAKMKEELWMSRNGTHMEEMERRRLAKKEEEEKERENPKKKRRVIKKQAIDTTNLGEAVYQVAKEKRISTKINYEILKEIDSFQKTDIIPLQSPVELCPVKEASPQPTQQPQLAFPVRQKPQPTFRRPAVMPNMACKRPAPRSSTVKAVPSPQSPVKAVSPQLQVTVVTFPQPPTIVTAPKSPTKPPTKSPQPVLSIPSPVVEERAARVPKSQPPSQPSVAPPTNKPKTQQRYKHTKMLPTAAMRSVAKKS